MRALAIAIAVVTGLLTSWLLGDVAFYVLCGVLLAGAGIYAGLQNRKEPERAERPEE